MVFRMWNFNLEIDINPNKVFGSRIKSSPIRDNFAPELKILNTWQVLKYFRVKAVVVKNQKNKFTIPFRTSYLHIRTLVFWNPVYFQTETDGMDGQSYPKFDSLLAYLLW